MKTARVIALCGLWLTLTPACDCGGPPPAGVDASARRYDAGQPEAGDLDVQILDQGAQDTSAPDVTSPDASTSDAARLDVVLAGDAAAADASGQDAVATDAAAADSLAPDTSLDATATDLGGPDAAVHDAAVADIAAADQGTADVASPDTATGCTSTCTAVGASRCLGNAVVTCMTQGACLVWGPPVACTGATSCSDGRCRTQCSDECTVEGATRCQSGLIVESCGQFDGDSCLEWGGASACTGTDVCSNGKCAASCSAECSAAGSRRCSGQSVEQCGDPDGDGCLNWTLVSTCSDSETCSLGVCAPRCLDECTVAGARECDGSGFRQCGNYDLDSCLEWGTTTTCPAATTCSGGVCQATCFDECTPAGSLSCQGNAWRSCGNHDTDSCLELSTATTCPAGTACNNGICAQTCTDDCNQAGSVECAGTGTRHCGNYDSDPCLDWGSITPCLPGTTCSAGVCQPSCSDECQSGQHRCSGAAAIQACGTNFDLDSCWDWGPPVTCASSTPNCEESTPGQAQCVVACTDACSLATPVTCNDGQSTIACVTGANACTAWQITACGTGRACMGTACVNCALDGLEANDSAATAHLLETIPYTSSTLTICSPDEDWFALDLSTGQALDVTLHFSHALGDIDLYAYDMNQQMLASSLSVSDDEHLVFAARASGRYYLRVIGFLGDSNTYTMDLAVHQCTDDGRESNDTRGDASLLTAAPLDVTGLMLCASDEDWYRYDLADGEGVSVDLIRTVATRSILIDLYDAQGQVLDYGSTITGGERVVLYGLASGSYYLRVYGQQSAEGGYSLHLAPYSCAIDAREDNDSQSEASPQNEVPATVTDLRLCPGDEDWFVVTVTEGQNLRVVARFVDADGDIDLHVYDSLGTKLAGSISTTDDETITLYNLAAGDYSIRVFSFYDIDNGYSLEFSVPPPCAQDSGEPNDDSGQATLIASVPYGIGGLALCQPDEDWYRFTPVAGQNIKIDIFFNDAEGNLDLTLLDSAQVDIGHSWSTTDNESVTLYNATATVHYLRVDSPGEDSNSYSLSLANVAACQDDPLEDNDSSTAAVSVLSLPYSRDDLMICGVDEDWFSVTALAGDSMRFEILFLDTQADLDLYVYDALLNTVGYSSSSTDNELVTLSNMAATTYYVRVYSFDDKSAPYQLRIRRP